MGNNLSQALPLRIARADDEEPTPAIPETSLSSVQLESLSDEEVEELKTEIIEEVVTKVAGEDGTRLADFLEPESLTAPYDPRFPNRNQARHCFVRFNEYHKCVFERGEDHPRCTFYQRSYLSMCPSDWLENWNELREKGLWTGKY
ncbi:hypothetical protein CEUSTIGMA_g5525.t1 [Chlamydomonas eustigma]|uniref:CHCH domain-containing protein n=1 Tax=Chlamydomonas eustigma TaxID=1157962 RepID=A0A250X4S8_9CHLO|nr:hypothetical protein CEUSTIGMA_g5525.t1 [Chlamydomonas eustigma]|eukprot:GAX78083.1 hypothetical protein CEUSTIGMA_g5525.t1 [Chlamydomonas eustigma]